MSDNLTQTAQKTRVIPGSLWHFWPLPGPPRKRPVAERGMKPASSRTMQIGDLGLVKRRFANPAPTCRWCRQHHTGQCHHIPID